MEHLRKEFREIAEAYGWVFVENNKNKLMDSYITADDKSIRINFYFTTNTLTLQGTLGFQTVKDCNHWDLEKFLIRGNECLML
jgi:hypothetical protein